jgi:hemoglobin
MAEAAERVQINPYQMLGGDETVRRLVNRFYDLMQEEGFVPELRAMHAGDLSPMRQKLYEFLSGWLGGPPLYHQRADSKCMGSAHKPFDIGERERDQWMTCIRRAMDDVGVPADLKPILDQALFRMADAMRAR